MRDDPLRSDILRAFAGEIEKTAIFSRVGKAARQAPTSALNFVADHPGATGLLAAGTGLSAVAGYSGLKGSKKGFQQHSYGSLPGTRNTPTLV